MIFQWCAALCHTEHGVAVVAAAAVFTFECNERASIYRKFFGLIHYKIGSSASASVYASRFTLMSVISGLHR